MIHLLGMTSPNVLKILLMLEEAQLPYELTHVSPMHGETRDPRFLELNPLGKVPVIVDDGDTGKQVVFESGAILIYLAETYAPQLFPQSGPTRWSTLEWLTAQVAYVGPMLGQLNHFQLVPSESGSYAAARYRDQSALAYRQLDDRLAKVEWFNGETHSIADIAIYPWSAYLSRHGFDEADHPHLTAWRARMDGRPAWRRALAALPALIDPEGRGEVTDSDMDRFFGRRSSGPRSDMAAYAALGSPIRGFP